MTEKTDARGGIKFGTDAVYDAEEQQEYTTEIQEEPEEEEDEGRVSHHPSTRAIQSRAVSHVSELMIIDLSI